MATFTWPLVVVVVRAFVLPFAIIIIIIIMNISINEILLSPVFGLYLINVFWRSFSVCILYRLGSCLNAHFIIYSCVFSASLYLSNKIDCVIVQAWFCCYSSADGVKARAARATHATFNTGMCFCVDVDDSNIVTVSVFYVGA